MNLYDKDDGFKLFDIEQANALLPAIIEKTERALYELNALQTEIEAKQLFDQEFAQERYYEKSAPILEKWSEEMIEIGVYPKGYFTVDFKSPVPDTLFCWTYGETEINHTHKIYETFKARRPIHDSNKFGFEEALN
ncbi:MAG: DUF2203 family protein [bacterium]